jgi:RNase adaptor protein for sRNA GlmZ degradation
MMRRRQGAPGPLLGARAAQTCPRPRNAHALSETLIHATCIALGDGPRPAGVLLRGPSGAGKSDLALRLIDRGARLVADDRTDLYLIDGELRARAPATIAGRMEVRGLGIADVPRVDDVPLRLVVDLVDNEAVERLPEETSCQLFGVEVPYLRLDPFQSSADAKLRLAVERHLDLGEARDRAFVDGAPEDNGEAAAESREPRRVVLVTGLSGAGRTAALNTLEDLGYEAIDNLPLELFDQVVSSGEVSAVALGIDIRTRNFAVAPFLELFNQHPGTPALDIRLLFIDCDDERLRRRYTETRRPHPLARERPVNDGIAAERRLLAPLRARADLVVDTSSLTPSDFRRVLSGHFRLEDLGGMSVFVTSFSYRNGLPREADLVFDVRFLDNPYYQDDLRSLTGQDRRVADFVRADPGYDPFFEQLTGMLGPLLPRYQREGKSYLTIALGCTGGRHRSVTTAEGLASYLRAAGYAVMLVHRELANLETQPSERLTGASDPDST